MWVGVPIVLLAVLAFGLNASGLLRQLGKANEPGILQKKGEPEGPGILRVEAKPPPVDLTQVPRGPQDTMPDDVREWLEHLHQIEIKRNKLANGHIGKFTAMMFELQGAGLKDVLEGMMGGDDSSGTQEIPSPAKDVAQDFEAARQEWRDLTDAFAGRQPPAECVPIRGEYEVALRSTSAAVFDLIEILEASNQEGADPKDLIGKLNSMKGESTNIDKAGKTTDELVQEICDKYNTKKWFDIAGDIGSGGLLGKFGGGL